MNEKINELHNTIDAKDKIINYQALEIARLKKQLNCKERLTKIMPPDTEFIILSKSDYDRQEKDIEEIALELRDKIDKAIEYIKNYDVFKEFTFPLMKRDEENQVKSSIDYQFKNDLKKNLLEIFGDKE